MKRIPLTQGFYALVDDADYSDLVKHRWYYCRGYARRNVSLSNGKQETVLMHRVLLGLAKHQKILADHANGNKLDNRRSNLRVCTSSQNAMNCPLGLDNTSGYKGAFWLERNQKWMSKIKVKGVQVYLGLYATAEDAHEVYLSAAGELHGDFANPGDGCVVLKGSK